MSAFEVIDYSPDMSTNQSSAAALRRVASPLDVNQQMEVSSWASSWASLGSSEAALDSVDPMLGAFPSPESQAVFDAVTATDESAARLAPRIDEPALRLSPLTPPVVPTAVTPTTTSAAAARPAAPPTTAARTMSSTGSDGTTDVKIAALAARLEQLERRYDQQRQTSQRILVRSLHGAPERGVVLLGPDACVVHAARPQLVALVMPFLALTVDRFWNRR